MRDKYKASAMFRALVDAVRPEIRCDMAGLLAALIDKAPRTVKSYLSDPDSNQFRIPPIEVLEALVSRVVHEHIHRPSTIRALSAPDAYLVGKLGLDDYVAALDLADALKTKVTTRGQAVIPELSDDARLRHQWRQVYFRGVVDRADLAIIAGIDSYDVMFVGREHPTFGIQPTFAMVTAAVALEALTSRRAA